MVCELSNGTRSPLLPDRYAQQDFFVCDIFDAAPKGDMASMEHPIFSLSTKPDTRRRRYTTQDGKRYAEIIPSSVGLATVHDRDILIYCISQIMAALNEGRQVHRTLRFKAHDLLIATNRQTNGQAYAALKMAFERLRGTTISTNITSGSIEQFDVFGLIERARIVRETREGRMLDVEITLSDWVFNAIEGKEVLTLSRRYFQLRKPLERRLYELARKHCGYQKKWVNGLDLLRQKCGSSSSLKEFRRLIGKIITDDRVHNHMPDYSLSLEGDLFVVRPKESFLERLPKPKAIIIGPLDAATFQKARDVAPGWDIYVLETEWRSWVTEPPKHPDAAFLGFCRKWFERRGRP